MPVKKRKKTSFQDLLDMLVYLADSIGVLVDIHLGRAKIASVELERKRVAAWLLFGPPRFEESLDWARVAGAIQRGDASMWTGANPEVLDELKRALEHLETT